MSPVQVVNSTLAGSILVDLAKVVTNYEGLKAQ